MPPVFGMGSFRFFFLKNKKKKPPHIHVKAAEDQAKFWLNPTQLASSYRSSSRVLNELERLEDQNEAVFLKAWKEYFGQHCRSISDSLSPHIGVGNVSYL